MAKLETQINQIYLTHPQLRKSSLILYEEALNTSAHLFFVAELKDLQKKSDSADLKKISEIILESFRANKKMPAEALFESALAQINQNLADLAHEGRKSWVGKFSCLIGLKAGETIYLANNGQTSAWLLRRSELLEILKPEKLGNHPLKTFVNFTQGKLHDGDCAILTTANIFNFVSMELFSKLLSSSGLEQATLEISKILQDSMGPEHGFSSFFLGFGNQEKDMVEEVTPTPSAQTIYAPLPEDEQSLAYHPGIVSKLKNFKFQIKKPNFKWPRLPQIKFEYFQNLSASGKFFFISFSIFLLLFAGNLIVYANKLHGKKVTNQINSQAETLAKDLADVQSSLIYKNDETASKFLTQAETDFAALKKLNSTKAQEFATELKNLQDQVNKVSVINEPKLFVELKHHPVFLAQTSIGLLFANQDSNSLSLFASGKLTDYFLLNSLKDPITGIANFSPAGVVVSAGNGIYHVDSTLKQFEPVTNINNAELAGIKTYSSGLYALNPPAGQVVKMTYTKGKFVTVNINAGDLKNIRDFGADKDIYLLYPDQINKVTNGQVQKFTLPRLSDPLSNASRIFVATNLYILEPNKKRVVILNKNGQLLNQIYLPSTESMSDLAVDEAGRNLFILDDNKLYKITF
jgi:hypothetical protein